MVRSLWSSRAQPAQVPHQLPVQRFAHEVVGRLGPHVVIGHLRPPPVP